MDVLGGLVPLRIQFFSSQLPGPSLFDVVLHVSLFSAYLIVSDQHGFQFA